MLSYPTNALPLPRRTRWTNRLSGSLALVSPDLVGFLDVRGTICSRGGSRSGRERYFTWLLAMFLFPNELWYVPIDCIAMLLALTLGYNFTGKKT